MTASISRSQAEKTAPLRHTKLAYMNSAAKPPREVLRRQMKHRSAEMLHSPAAVNGKRTTVTTVTSSASGCLASPKKPHTDKRHSASATVSSVRHAESSAQLKGFYAAANKHLCIFVVERLPLKRCM